MLDEETINSWAISQVCLFFFVVYQQKLYNCALLHNFKVVADPTHTEITGMAIVKRAMQGNQPCAHIVSLYDILWAVHLVPVFSVGGGILKGYNYESILTDTK